MITWLGVNESTPVPPLAIFKIPWIPKTSAVADPPWIVVIVFGCDKLICCDRFTYTFCAFTNCVAVAALPVHSPLVSNAPRFMVIVRSVFWVI
jgi:hypothetical protein